MGSLFGFERGTLNDESLELGTENAEHPELGTGNTEPATGALL